MLCITSRTSEQTFVSAYRVYFVGNNNILMWIFELQFPIKSRFVIEYLCVLFVGDSVKRRPRRFIREHMGLEIIRENETDVSITEAYITKD
jgi:hypothetical protein